MKLNNFFTKIIFVLDCSGYASRLFQMFDSGQKGYITFEVRGFCFLSKSSLKAVKSCNHGMLKFFTTKLNSRSFLTFSLTSIYQVGQWTIVAHSFIAQTKFWWSLFLYLRTQDLERSFFPSSEYWLFQQLSFSVKNRPVSRSVLKVISVCKAAYRNAKTNIDPSEYWPHIFEAHDDQNVI